MSSTSINPATLEFIQKENARRSRQRKIAMIVGAVMVVGIAAGGYFGISAWKTASQENKAKELAAKMTVAGPGNGFEEMRKAVDSGQITWDQARAAGREAWEAEQQKRMDAYFATPAKDRDKYLDKLIDEMQKRMKEMEARRAANPPTTRPDRGDRGNRGNGPTTRPEGERGDRGPGGGRGNADNTSPVQRAQRGEFMAAMQRRMQERGIQMRGRGGWGGGGGGGGGRGPGGGGR